MAHSLSNISDKNYQHRPMHVEVTVCNIGVVFFSATQCVYPTGGGLLRWSSTPRACPGVPATTSDDDVMTAAVAHAHSSTAALVHMTSR